jgi:hypothetical protein
MPPKVSEQINMNPMTIHWVPFWWTVCALSWLKAHEWTVLWISLPYPPKQQTEWITLALSIGISHEWFIRMVLNLFWSLDLYWSALQLLWSEKTNFYLKKWSWPWYLLNKYKQQIICFMHHVSPLKPWKFCLKLYLMWKIVTGLKW